MPYFNRKHQRLPNYDYASQNVYYVTICTWNRNPLFGMGDRLTALGQIAKEELEQISGRYKDVVVEKYVVMPNHIHALIAIGCKTPISKDVPSLPAVVGSYKSGVSRRIHEHHPELCVWQKSFYDEIIRSDNHYQQAWNYIDGNPLKWMEDDYFILP